MKITVGLSIFFALLAFQVKAKEQQNTNYGTITVRSYGAIPDDGNDDALAIRNAIAAAIATNAPQIVLFEAGRYDLNSSVNNAFHIRLLNANNVILRGVTINNLPATKLVRFNTGVENASLPVLLNIRFSSNVTIENFILDNAPYYYTAGVVTAKSGNTVTADILPNHPMNIVKPYIMGIYDKVNEKNKTLRVTWDTGLPTWTPVSGGSARLMQLNFKALADSVLVGDQVFWFQGNHGGTQCVTSKSSNITFNNVITHNSTGFVYHFVDNDNITLNRVKIEPTDNRIAVAPRDGIHLAHNRGFLLLDSVVVKNTPGDDGLNVHGEYLSISTISGKTITFAENIVSDLRPNSRIQFVDANFQPVWTGTVESSNPVVANNVPVTVVLKETPPSWIVPGTIASPLGWIAKSIVIRNSVFENTGRFGVLARINNVVIDSSRFRFNGNAGIALGSNYNIYFKESQNTWNIVVKNNFFENNILRMGDNTGPGGVYVDQFFVENPNINGNLFLFNNTFQNETYAYNLRDAMNIHLWGNVYNNVTTPIWRNLPTTSNFTQSVVYNNIVTDDSYRNAIYYCETWPTSSNAQDTLGTVTWNNKSGSFAEFHFVGNHISYYARRGTQMGKVDVYLDDVLVLDDFDLYSHTVQTKSLIYSNSNLQNTTHTLRIVNTGLKNASATDNYVNIDYLMHRLGNYIVSPTQTGGVLPVNLISFTGKVEQHKIKLDWQTTNEVNNSHFDVLKLNKKEIFTSIGLVNAQTSNRPINTYSIYDVEPNDGVNYYQLKQFDLDGKASLSKIVSVNFSATSIFSVYPNPTKVGELIKIRFTKPETEVFVQLIDMSQRVILQKSFDGAQQNIELSSKALQPGIYILNVKTTAGQFSNKIVVIP
jgi:Secretion system C-terminal sorting domain/Pectate lyase superfamily protein